MPKAKANQEAQPEAALKPRPARSEEELDRMREAHGRTKARRVPVTVEAAREADGTISLEPPHDDGAGWRYRLMDAVGSGSGEFAVGQVNLLGRMLGTNEPSPQITMNAMLAAVDAVRPENETEGMLAVQMAATHHLAMRCLAAATVAKTPQQREVNGNLATKMLRTYTAQLEALAKSRRGGEQKVRVEHVHVYQGGQAIVGHVEAKGGGGLLENGHQAHALSGPAAYALSPDASLLREDPARAGVHGAGGEGEEPLPDARRGEG